MSEFVLERTYSLYNEDNGVELYYSLEEAERVKANWEQVVPVTGPFEHTCVIKDLNAPASSALEVLLRIHREYPHLAEYYNLETITQQLKDALEPLDYPNAGSGLS